MQMEIEYSSLVESRLWDLELEKYNLYAQTVGNHAKKFKILVACHL